MPLGPGPLDIGHGLGRRSLQAGCVLIRWLHRAERTKTLQ